MDEFEETAIKKCNSIDLFRMVNVRKRKEGERGRERGREGERRRKRKTEGEEERE